MLCSVVMSTFRAVVCVVRSSAPVVVALMFMFRLLPSSVVQVSVCSLLMHSWLLMISLCFTFFMVVVWLWLNVVW